MGRAFQGAGGTLGERLLAAAAAAEEASPVRDEAESAALLVVRDGGGPDGGSDRMVDLRVDSAADAVQELRSLYAAYAATFLPAAYARFGDEARRRGDSISAEREYARAENGFRAAVARRPKDTGAMNELAWFLAVHDRALPEAIEVAQRAISLQPNDPILYDTLAEAQYRAGALARAIDAMDRAVRLSGGSPRYADRLARWTRERDVLEGKGEKKP
jgi:predicted Zn-dependent protease